MRSSLPLLLLIIFSSVTSGCATARPWPVTAERTSDTMRAFECLAKLNRLNGILCIAEHPVERTCLRYTIGAVELELAELGYCAENEDGLWVLVWTREGSLPSSSDLSTKEREALNVFTLNFAADGLVDFAGEGAFFYHRAKEELMALGYRVEHDDERQPNPLGYGFPYLVKTDGQTR